MRWWCTSALLPPLLLLGCAKAGPIGNGAMPDAPNGLMGNPDASGFTHPDADTHIDAAIDAKPIDAPPGMETVTLTQTTNNTVAADNSIACALEDGDGTRQDTYYRVFDLGSAGITTTFSVSSVTFAVEDCDTASGLGTNVAVHVGTYSGTIPTAPGGTLTAADITVDASNNVVGVPEIDEASGDPPQNVSAPITASIPGSSKMVVEVEAPDGSGSFNFFLGTSTGGQTALGYISSPECTPAITAPTDIQSLGSANSKIDVLITVTGTYTL
jgi:hypothetical protein